MSDSAPAAHGPLAGVTVLDLSRLLPGPFCTQLLVDFGATVIKIEDPAGGDYLRHTPPLAADGTSLLFHALNRGKKSVTLDLKTEEGRAGFWHLAATADVVVESFRPGVLARLDLSPAALRQRHPQLVVCSISGYGQTGPLARRAGHDVNYVARAGAFALMKEPTLLPVQLADLAGGAWPAAMQICAALVGRARSGEGATIDVSMRDGVAGLLAMTLARVHAEPGDVEADFEGGADLLVGRVPCYGLYPTRDGWLSVGALEPKFWAAFCAALDAPDLLGSGYETGEAGEAVRSRITALLQTRTTAEWEAVFAATDACVEPVLDARAALAHSPQVTVAVDGAAAPLAFAQLGLGMVGVAPSAVRAPLLGEHNGALLPPPSGQTADG